MHRRDFIKTAAILLAASRRPAYAEQFAESRKRLGLIGAGWYGKSDLLRLIQVAPVEVVSLCDVDRRMLADAAALVASRQALKGSQRSTQNSLNTQNVNGPSLRVPRVPR